MNKLSALGGVIVVIAHIALIIFCGVWAWNWTEPENFWGALAFIVLWGILDYVAHLIIMGVAFVIFSND